MSAEIICLYIILRKNPVAKSNTISSCQHKAVCFACQAVLFLRIGYAVGYAGIVWTVGIFLLSFATTAMTAWMQCKIDNNDGKNIWLSKKRVPMSHSLDTL